MGVLDVGERAPSGGSAEAGAGATNGRENGERAPPRGPFVSALATEKELRQLWKAGPALLRPDAGAALDLGRGLRSRLTQALLLRLPAAANHGMLQMTTTVMQRHD